ncbi:type II toxin-antitoxin system Phd/YefM family antitoxin [Chromatiaceae bacterium AAb-1]|nr:type II toxin-antitoxin system Phd/YefM family antitoxin [Chromatiaceae bacterium AAb-1]
MESLTANQAKTNFGSLLLKAQVEPVQINKNGKPVAVVISVDAYDAMDKVKLEMLRLRAKEVDNIDDLVDGDTFFDELLADM